MPKDYKSRYSRLVRVTDPDLRFLKKLSKGKSIAGVLAELIKKEKEKYEHDRP